MGLFSRKRSSPSSELELQAGELGLERGDVQVLKALLDCGVDLDRPRHALHYLYLPDQETARAAADEVEGTGWSAGVREPLPDFPGQWCVVAERPDVVLGDLASVRESTEVFAAIAARHGGEHDGWEAAVD